MPTLLDRRIGIDRAAVICGVPAGWLRRAAAGTAVGDTVKVREAFALAGAYPRDDADKHRRLGRLAGAEAAPRSRARRARRATSARRRRPA